jgi:hypothetical protein
MKWEQYVLLLLDPQDFALRQSALRWKRRYRIPDHLCFSVGAAKGYATLHKKSLSLSNENTKILVICHGDSDNVGVQGVGYAAQPFATFLRYHGLRRAGLLALKGCYLGKAAFLDHLAVGLQIHGCRVNWLIGYRGSAVQLPFCSHETVGDIDFWWRLITLSHSKLSDHHRVKVIPGWPGAAPLPGSQRYTAARLHPSANSARARRG